MNKKSCQPNQIVKKCSYILRLWRVDEFETSNWRASLEIPDTGKRIGFASLEQLFAFLMDLSENNCDLQMIEDSVKEVGNK
jgi:hypothetical protein